MLLNLRNRTTLSWRDVLSVNSERRFAHAPNNPSLFEFAALLCISFWVASLIVVTGSEMWVFSHRPVGSMGTLFDGVVRDIGYAINRLYVYLMFFISSIFKCLLGKRIPASIWIVATHAFVALFSIISLHARGVALTSMLTICIISFVVNTLLIRVLERKRHAEV